MTKNQIALAGSGVSKTVECFPAQGRAALDEPAGGARK